MGEAYQQLTTSLPFDYDSVIADKADIIATISLDKDIIDVNEVNGKSVGSIGGVTRWVHFRDDNFNVDCGARFDSIVDKVELSVDNYVNAIEEAIKSASGITSEKDIEKKKVEEVKAREEVAKINAVESKSVDPEENKRLAEVIKAKFPTAEATIKAQIKELLTSNEIKLGTPEDAKTAVLKEIVKLLG